MSCIHHEQDHADEGQHRECLGVSPEGTQWSTEEEVCKQIPALGSGALLGVWIKGAKSGKDQEK